MALKLLKEDGIRKVIAIAAGKGGVGKSTVTVNLALALQQRGYRMGIFDADLYGPSIRRMLPETVLPKNLGTKMIPAESNGIKTISLAFFRQENESASIRAPIANQILGRFMSEVDWGGLDFLLVDFPPGTGDIQLTLCQQAPLFGALLVTTPQEVASADVRKAAHLFAQVKVPILGVVENMSYFTIPQTGAKAYPFGQGGGKRLAEEMGVRLLEEIPIDERVSKCCDRGQSLFNEEGGDAVLSFRRLGREIEDQVKGVKPLILESMRQVSSNVFEIVWGDGARQHFSLPKLQVCCPCASCIEKNEFKENPRVKARGIATVGRYALRIDFDSGCSNGIYGFDLLRKIGEPCN